MTFGVRQCLECDGAFTAARQAQRYCTADCRSAFHRRREKRGAELYDLLMIQRFERKGHGPQAHKLVCRLASQFRKEDAATGRKRSWLSFEELRADGALAAVAGDDLGRIR